jgi:ABC-type sugar transport system permease subunit
MKTSPMSQRKLALILIIPAVVVIFGIVIYPLLNALYQSFFNTNLAYPQLTKFIWLGNYLSIFKDIYFWKSIYNTVYFTVISMILELIFGFIVALVLNEKFFMKWLVRTLIIIPWAIPPVVNATVWKWIANSEYGSLNSILKSLGIIKEYRIWLSDPFWSMMTVILADVWKYTPLVAIMLLAALQTIPEDLYEAAKIDGANSFRRTISITIPLIKPTIIVVLILRTFEAFKVFDLIFVMTRGGPAFKTTVISYFTYLETFSQLNIGRGSAIAYIIVMFMSILSYLYIRSMKDNIN